jgi:hypothetical protein
LQPQLRPKYVARLERHLSEGGVWGLEVGEAGLDRKEPDIAVIEGAPSKRAISGDLEASSPTLVLGEDLDPDALELRKQRRIVIYVQSRPRIAVTSLEILSPSNKQPGSIGRARYLEKRSSALHGGLHWVEIDLLRGGERPPIPMEAPAEADYLGYVARAVPSGWKHLLFAWKLRDALPRLPIPLLGEDEVVLDLAACFAEAYERTAADDEADYEGDPAPPPLRSEDAAWVDRLLRDRGLRERRG